MGGNGGERLPATFSEIERHINYPKNIVRISPDKRFCGDGRQLDVFTDQEGAVFTFGADGGIFQAMLATLHRFDSNLTPSKIRSAVDGVARAYADVGQVVHLHSDDHTEDPEALKDGIFRFMIATGDDLNWTGCGHNKNGGNPDVAQKYGLEPQTLRIAFKHLGEIHRSLLRVKILHGNHNEVAVLTSDSFDYAVVPFNEDTLQAFVVTPNATAAFVRSIKIPHIEPHDLFGVIQKHQEVTARILAKGRELFYVCNSYYPNLVPIVIAGGKI